MLVELARLEHGAEDARTWRTSASAGVERDDGGAAARRLEGVAAEAAAEVEHALVGGKPEAVVVDRQHAGAPVFGSCGAPGSGSPARIAA